MAMVIDESIVGLWYLEMSNGNLGGGIWRIPDARGFIMRWRFRYYLDDKTFDSNDKKNFYSLESNDLNKLLFSFRYIIKMGEETFNTKAYEFLRGENESVDDFAARYLKAPFIHMREATPEEVEEIEREHQSIG